jgi:Baseplate J-like protein
MQMLPVQQSQLVRQEMSRLWLFNSLLMSYQALHRSRTHHRPSEGLTARRTLFNWALSVAGVGGVAVLSSDEPGGPGADKVSIAIIDQAGQPASQSLVDAVQDYIAPPWINTTEAENAALTGAGVTVDLTQTDDIGNSVLMVHNAAQGFIRDTIRSVSLSVPQHGGQWDVRVRMKVGGVLGAGNLVTIRVWDDSAGAVAPAYFGGPAASATYTAAQLNAAFTDYLLRYYDNGVDYYHLEVIRETADATSNLWVDRMVYQSEFGQSGKTIAPTGAFVNVLSAVPITINFSVALTITAGYDVNSVRTAVQNAVVSYLQSLALQPNNDVQYARVGTAILNTPGVSDYANLTINGGTANVAIGPQQVAVFGAATWL